MFRDLMRHPTLAVQTARERFRSRLDRSMKPGKDSNPGASPEQFLADLSGVSLDDAARALDEVPAEHLSSEIATALKLSSLPAEFPEAAAPSGDWIGPLKVLHALVRILHPQRVVETGVGIVGSSSTFLLAALERNGVGELWSIDRDRYFSLSGFHVGQGIPHRLRTRHHLVFEDSRSALPRVLAKSPPASLFYHDGLHTYENMRFEFEQAWAHLPPLGIIVADDALNSSLDDFGGAVRQVPRILSYGSNRFGGIRKPPSGFASTT